jgi:putative nucleotidyltransferase with HDIG domain
MGGAPARGVAVDTLNMAAPAAPPLKLVGRVIANHRLVTELGSGGMGYVFYAEHVVIGRRAAIKILKPEVSRDKTVTSRFLNEARAANEIHHPNVIEITDIGQEGDLHYIVMNFLEGETLGERIERAKTLDEETTLRIARQVVSALSAAHDRGIVHRDLNPDNIFITNPPDFPDYVKVLDFGIAKLLGAGHAGAAAEASGGLTQVGTVLGTPWYMSPEQCRGGTDLDARSDIYSLSVVLYQALTGQVPFLGAGAMEVIIAHVTQPPVPPVEKNRKISAHVNAAILRGMEKDPAKRFANMREFWNALSNTREPVIELCSPAATTPNMPAVPESAEDKGARNVASKLTEIIKARIAEDRLLLPAMPAIAVECLRVIKDPRQTFKTVGQVIAKDPLLSSRILKMANSAAFPGLSPAATLESAIARMGIEGLTVILVQFSLYQAFTSRDERIRASFRGIWEHSLAVALIAKELAQKLVPSGPDPSATYLAGLLHDVGKPVVASMLAEAEKQISKGAKGAWVSESVWRKIVHESHRPVGVLLARKWNLPKEVVTTLENCDAYERTTPRASANVVRLANALAKRSGLYVGAVDNDEIEKVIAAGQLLVGIPADILDQTCRDIYARVATMLDGVAKRGAVRS